MKAVVFSDSHGDTAAMREAVEREAPDQILHLGDLAGDAERLGIRFPQIPLEYVCGNCDGFCLAPAVRLLELRGRRVLMMHGHTHRVKTGYGGAIAAARQAGADILLFGHTHQAYAERLEDGLWVMNPGSCQSWDRTTYGVILLEKTDTLCYTVPV